MHVKNIYWSLITLELFMVLSTETLDFGALFLQGIKHYSSDIYVRIKEIIMIFTLLQ